MRQITTDQLFHLLQREGKFFSVTFERRTNSARRFQLAGDVRTVLCKTGMTKYKRGIVPDAVRAEEDFRCAVLTVWSLGDYFRLRQRGIDRETAGFDAWRRIDLTTVRECSLLDDVQLPPFYNPLLHEITNVYRRNNIPRIIS